MEIGECFECGLDTEFPSTDGRPNELIDFLSLQPGIDQLDASPSADTVDQDTLCVP